VVFQRVLNGWHNIGQGGNVEYPVYGVQGTLELGGFGHVNTVYFQPRVVFNMLQVRKPAGGKVIQYSHLVAVCQQPLHQVATNEPGATRDCCSFGTSHC
jgi:hypothetical protein